MRLKKNLIVDLNAKVGHIFLKFYHSLNHRFHLRLLTFNPSGFVWKIESAARLEWKSFFVAGKAKAKRLGAEGGIAAQIKILLIKNHGEKILIIRK